MNESALILSATKSRLSLIHPANKSSRWEKVYGGKGLLKSEFLSSEWKTERVREDGSGNSEDGEDDELPCVISESEWGCILQL